MKQYRAPLNPRHTTSFTEEDFWWVENAWDKATLDWLLGLTVPKEDRHDGFWSILEYITDAAKMNIPGLAPSGDWLTSFALAHRDNSGGLFPWVAPTAETTPPFEEWTRHNNLSRPVRYATYVRENYDDDGARILSQAILSLADFTEEDIAYLACIKPDYYTRTGVVGALSNPGFVNHPTYSLLVDRFLTQWEAHQAAAPAYCQEVAPVIANPAAPSEVLSRVSARFNEVRNLLNRLYREPAGANLTLPGETRWEEDAYSHWQANTFFYAREQWQHYTKENIANALASNLGVFIGTLGSLELHPNWVESQSENLSEILSSPESFFPTCESTYKTARTDAKNVLTGEKFGKMRHELEVELKWPGVAPYSMLVSVAPAYGTVIRERREALGTGEDIPDEWVNLAFS